MWVCVSKVGKNIHSMSIIMGMAQQSLQTCSGIHLKKMSVFVEAVKELLPERWRGWGQSS